MTEKHEFGSRGWFETLFRTIERLIREAADDTLPYSACEVFAGRRDKRPE